jgi:hypothetical protein
MGWGMIASMRMAALLLVLAVLPSPRKMRDEVFVDSESRARIRTAGESGEARVPPLSFVGGMLIFPGIIAAPDRIPAVEWPVRPLKSAFSRGP